MKKTHKERRRGPLMQRLWMGAVSLLMTGLVVLQNGVLPRVEALAVEMASMQPPVAAAYVYDQGKLDLRDGDAPYLTQMNYSFALIENGKVTGSHWRSIKTFEKYIARHPHILPVMAVGGWGADGFSQAAATQEGREAFGQSAVELMEKHGFRGIDIDWEYPGSTAAGIAAAQNDKENLTLLLTELRSRLDAMEELDGKERYLAIALGAAPANIQFVDLEAVGRLVDQVNVMTYDLCGFDKTTGHHANLYTPQGQSGLSGDGAVKELIAAGIPKEKIMLGAAAYGRCWRQVQGGGDGLGQRAATSGNRTYPYAQLKEMVKDYEAYWDDEAKAPYLFNGSQFISYEDPRSLQAKGAYASQNGLMGVMLWEYGKDNGDLIKALHEGLN